MEVDLAFEVAEVEFDKFERRKMPRENLSVIEIQNKTFFSSFYDEADNAPTTYDLGIDVNEVPFEQFERRKHPR